MSSSCLYRVLGVRRNASPEAIKVAYYKLAKQCHPDTVPAHEKEAASARFNKINEAYELLKDAEKRRIYDMTGSASFRGGMLIF